jgi:UDP-N-acetylglucosamine--N-acetylmuramyl-(pentapeptide) pyrophosphoryl-undecaprenol N-acetylglucosamine transferase
MPQSELSPQRLAEQLNVLIQSPESLALMSEKARGLAKPDAAEIVANYCLSEAKA